MSLLKSHTATDRVRTILPLLTLAAAVVLVYSPSRRSPFLLDDSTNIVNNPAIRRMWPLSAALNPPPVDMTFFTRPFINLTMCMDYAVSGLDPRGYHRTNLMLHLAASLALFGLARRTLLRVHLEDRTARALGLVAALAWAVHPINTSAVIYLSQRGELGVGLFLFLMLYGLNRAIPTGAEAGAPPGNVVRGEGPRPRGPLFEPRGRCPSPNTGQDSGGPATSRAVRWFLASVFFCLLGMGSKESMLGAPLLAVAYDRIFLSNSWAPLLRKRWGYYLALALTWVWPLSRLLTYSPHVPEGGFSVALLWRYLLTQAWGLTRMVRLILWPHPLIFEYGTDLIQHIGQVWAPMIFMLMLLILTLALLRRRPALGFPLLAFFVLLAPSSSLLPITGQPIAEHRLYAASAGLLLLLALAGWSLLRGRSTWRVAAAALWILALGFVSYERNALYTDRLALWRDTVAQRPTNDRAWGGVGQALHDLGRLEEAVRSYEEALRRKESAITRGSLGITLHALGRYEEALRQFNAALKQRPADAQAEHWRGRTLAAMGRTGEAIAAQRRVLELEPDYVAAHYELANALVAAGSNEEALAEYREAIRLQPAALDAHGRLALLRLKQERRQDALAALEEGARISGAPARAYFEFSNILLSAGYSAEGLAMARRHLELEPDHPGSLNNAAWIMSTSTNADLRNGPEAVKLAQRALRLSPEPSAALWSTLAAAQAEDGQFTQAVASMNNALALARKAGDTNLAAKIKIRFDMFNEGKAWRE